MQVQYTDIEGLVEVTPQRFGDERGWVSETWSSARELSNEAQISWTQDNESLSHHRGTIRGLHLQLPPFEQCRLVRCITGQILDVAVDLRRGSDTYGQHVATVLSADTGNQLFVPTGFAHGFCALTDDCLVGYKVGQAHYEPDSAISLRWDDPQIAIEWPDFVNPDFLSPRDRDGLTLRDYEARAS